jgi:hypothetical protein
LKRPLTPFAELEGPTSEKPGRFATVKGAAADGERREAGAGDEKVGTSGSLVAVRIVTSITAKRSDM